MVYKIQYMDMCYKDCYMYTVQSTLAVVKGLHRVKYIHTASLWMTVMPLLLVML